MRCLYFIILISLFACQNEKPYHPLKKTSRQQASQEIIDELKTLNSDSLKGAYLQEIYSIDQSLRREDSEYRQKYGYHPQAEKNRWKKINEADNLNLQKIEAYLEMYDYPHPLLIGKVKSQTPWLIIHHSSDIETREKNLHHLYNAYKNGRLSASYFATYLQRWHKMKFGKMIKMENPFTNEEEITTLMRALKINQENLEMEDLSMN